MVTRPITVAQTELFLRQATRIWSPEEHEAFIDFIALNPEAGDVVPGLGGIRKVRWSREGMGKRGGSRVVYFFYDEDAPIYLLQIYAKGAKSDLSNDDKKSLRAAASTLKAVVTRNRK
jgi:hypothetical protein